MRRFIKLDISTLIDEAPSIANDNFRNVFYGQIRAISTARAAAQPESLPRRVRFIFSGTFQPETLVNSVNSPSGSSLRPLIGALWLLSTMAVIDWHLWGLVWRWKPFLLIG